MRSEEEVNLSWVPHPGPNLILLLGRVGLPRSLPLRSGPAFPREMRGFSAVQWLAELSLHHACLNAFLASTRVGVESGIIGLEGGAQSEDLLDCAVDLLREVCVGVGR